MDRNASKASNASPSYGTIFIILAVFTGLEVAASTLQGPLKYTVLVLLALTKASLVILYFMHLKRDSRVYAFPLILGIVLALPLILIMLATMPQLR